MTLTLKSKRVLLIDLDPQCNATEGLTSRKYSRTVIGMLEWMPVRKCIYKTRFKDLDILRVMIISPVQRYRTIS
ncbi:ParA family protein [[Clostridium] innocuum]|uniref:ParA family protein n=1 Tax=Clostridium innocuum TaxID=1522 RepID=UPI0020A39917|nr:AAA family ATPase [[Clostridium] innocuum]